MTAVRIVCPRCAVRYAGVVDPRCGACRGFGILAAQGEEPLVAARALHGHLFGGASEPATRRRAAREVGLLAPVAGSTGIDVVPTDTAVRSGIGRRAGSLLIRLGLRPKPPPRQKPDRETAAARAEERRRIEELRREGAERARRVEEEHRRQRIEAKAAEALAARYPEEFAEMVEREGPMLAIEEMWWA